MRGREDLSPAAAHGIRPRLHPRPPPAAGPAGRLRREAAARDHSQLLCLDPEQDVGPRRLHSTKPGGPQRELSTQHDGGGEDGGNGAEMAGRRSVSSGSLRFRQSLV